jgi:SAM-dependent methyltransferase
MNYNKVLDIADFDDPDLSTCIREAMNLAPDLRIVNAKVWEIGMTVRALVRFGAIRPDAEVLGVGAGSEATPFYLSRHIRRVFATDLYVTPGAWEKEATPRMLTDPGACVPPWIQWDRRRLVVQHMDGRDLHYPDESFDGVFSNGSIEHFGDLDDVARAAAEMGRVVKRGGVVTLATEFRIAGNNELYGLPNTILFTPRTIQEAIIRPSGLRAVDPIDFHVSAATRELAYPFVEAVEKGGRPVSVALTIGATAWTSIFLTLVKD